MLEYQSQPCKNKLKTRGKVTHKEWDFIDDCTELILLVSLYLWCPASVKSVSKPLKQLK